MLSFFSSPSQLSSAQLLTLIQSLIHSFSHSFTHQSVVHSLISIADIQIQSNPLQSNPELNFNTISSQLISSQIPAKMFNLSTLAVALVAAATLATASPAPMKRGTGTWNVDVLASSDCNGAVTSRIEHFGGHCSKTPGNGMRVATDGGCQTWVYVGNDCAGSKELLTVGGCYPRVFGSFIVVC
ncbi:hypothetical protein BDV95DRAFT_588053 [Massariosphaeria phaeospora]|uniref:Uncharacterized protein n=1 Tax=Massariosphaeria phaeospora TaxID=100035 RepID=A0A7C8M3Q3_9PLEO|nr:hypothetical protein BDV95DRAFT_588053 [Massariosphaeria phaeospora]